MNQISMNWNWRRLLRLVLSILIIGQGIVTKEWLFVLLGLVFAALAIFNKSMCGIGQQCEANANIKPSDKEDIYFEEVK